MSQLEVHHNYSLKQDTLNKQELNDTQDSGLPLYGTALTTPESPAAAVLIKAEELKFQVPSNKRHDFSCKACSKTYRSKKRYHAHIETVHKTSTSHLVPDKHDPNCYCKPCDRTYFNRRIFQTHLRYSHNILMTKLEPDKDDPNSYCRACELTYATRGKYVNHLFGVHKIRIKKPVVYSQLTPDEHDLNNFCNVCEKTYAQNSTFRIHIREVHDLKTTPLAHNRVGIINLNLLPDQSDPNFYCRSCEKSFSAKCSFYNHIRVVHEMKIILPSSLKLDTQLLPNIDDPNFYCCACGRSYHNRNNYGNHLRKVHKLRSNAKRVFGVYSRPSSTIKTEDN